jgi:hypothetical protein
MKKVHRLFNEEYCSFVFSESVCGVGVQPGVPLLLCVPFHLCGALPLHLHHHGHLRDYQELLRARIPS